MVPSRRKGSPRAVFGGCAAGSAATRELECAWPGQQPRVLRAGLVPRPVPYRPAARRRVAEHRHVPGRHIRVLVARDPGGLRGKLQTVEGDEPGPDNPPGVAQPGGGWISGPCT
jgi:hypothetical protein